MSQPLMDALPQLEARALALPGAALDLKWGVRVLSIEHKMFAIFQAASLSFKVADADFLAISGLPGAKPAPYLARARWVQLTSLQALALDEIDAALQQSYRLVLAKLPQKVQRQYGVET